MGRAPRARPGLVHSSIRAACSPTTTDASHSTPIVGPTGDARGSVAAGASVGHGLWGASGSRLRPCAPTRAAMPPSIRLGSIGSCCDRAGRTIRPCCTAGKRARTDRPSGTPPDNWTPSVCPCEKIPRTRTPLGGVWTARSWRSGPSLFSGYATPLRSRRSRGQQPRRRLAHATHASSKRRPFGSSFPAPSSCVFSNSRIGTTGPPDLFRMEPDLGGQKLVHRLVVGLGHRKLQASQRVEVVRDHRAWGNLR